ncbi:MAG: RNA polymerase sigma-70 factor [Bacteroidia bacterium]
MSNQSFHHLTDEELLQLSRKNQAEAFGVIYDRYWSRLYASAFLILEDTEACKDILQDVFIDFWNKRNQTEISHINAYLYQSVRFQVFKYLRKGNITQKHLSQINQIITSNPTEETVNFNEVNQSISNGMNLLPERCREVFYLSRFEHLSHGEIAEKMGISTKTVENQITKALRQLRMVVNHPALLLLSTVFLWG